MNGSKLDWFAAKGTLTPLDVTPWQTFSGKGMRFELEAYDLISAFWCKTQVRQKLSLAEAEDIIMAIL